MLRHESAAVSIAEATYEAHLIPDQFPETLVEIENPQGSIIVTQKNGRYNAVLVV